MRIIAVMMETARTSATSVDNYFTRQYILEDKSELQQVGDNSLLPFLETTSCHVPTMNSGRLLIQFQNGYPDLPFMLFS
jgi:hypothetical protein